MNALTLRARILSMFASANIPNELAIEVTDSIMESVEEAEMSNGWALNLAKDFVLIYEDDSETALQEFKSRLID